MDQQIFSTLLLLKNAKTIDKQIFMSFSFGHANNGNLNKHSRFLIPDVPIFA